MLFCMCFVEFFEWICAKYNYYIDIWVLFFLICLELFFLQLTYRMCKIANLKFAILHTYRMYSKCYLFCCFLAVVCLFVVCLLFVCSVFAVRLLCVCCVFTVCLLYVYCMFTVRLLCVCCVCCVFASCLLCVCCPFAVGLLYSVVCLFCVF